MIIPAIDLIQGKTVRLYQGSYDKTTEYQQTPLQLRDLYAKAGAGILHLVDLTGAKNAADRQLELLTSLMKNAPLPVQVGGGVRTAADVEQLLAAGASRVVVGSVAIREPETVQGWLRSYGGDKIVLALDVSINAKGDKTLPSHGWIEESTITLEQVLDGFIAAGAKHVLCTDISKDGTLQGPNVALYAELVQKYPQIQWQASGGVGSLADIKALKPTGVAGVILGRALLEGKFTAEEAMQCWQDA
ncbi:1-(5-phosphoribosyl)-5-[(5-phosphoribosylamino)methylideneamino]imidazole-4-carboxamide isomerase [Rheinheimera tangshanensis]|uniref:1-(5-phosphoribosyl)-5-[(5-phosphoribosylamino)methylideneamino] imidazole-4-carboxamide isomerase n=1 Tax=Rheinheimera tangshanensis TaxID=400153 RepID=A0A5C8LTH3_9GAMM|nr:1-(5-phosphoribosyl)-5-[(5-phosphoribosylamino)methylideneamino]imidazole-4-carboxamide isomerase [Rheinheimera tangshanensis]TXK79515.1 1-(5-phosphoribosyl)-5-[(5-phosphoribosylamino)methylideneamino]imidazole-4-carboxamide isomerase [Rheinheimera tangshanensis]GGM50414.1 1-(5-phosphoribosyl)-5-[(5-phosphoribosylamino) methylideneamino] imidazole-4-carboxamide isomerase [Rheinheimera tangshanensis]